ncbi:MAG: CPBP family intramembrane metalloprotease [Anaerolineae bacterium]|jgi:hypothetical protein
MVDLLFYLPFLTPVVTAQFGQRRRWAVYATYGLLIAINLGLLGFVGLALLNQLAEVLSPGSMDPEALVVNWLVVAAICLLTAVVAFLPLIPVVRRWMARWLPIDPGSLVHTTALAFAVYQIGLSLAQLALIGNLETLADAEVALTPWDVVTTGIPLLLFGLAGVGLFVRRDVRGVVERLALRRPTLRQLLVAVGVTLLLLAFDYGVTLLWQAVDPAGYDLVDRVANNIFGDLLSLGGAVALGLSAGISEEVLFRGAVQPRLGLLLTTLLFAIGHIQYGLTLATVEIYIIGLALGLLRNRTSTTICIVVHASYNAAGVLLGMA